MIMLTKDDDRMDLVTFVNCSLSFFIEIKTADKTGTKKAIKFNYSGRSVQGLSPGPGNEVLELPPAISSLIRVSTSG
jgi:hypothetical protein